MNEMEKVCGINDKGRCVPVKDLKDQLEANNSSVISKFDGIKDSIFNLDKKVDVLANTIESVVDSLPNILDKNNKLMQEFVIKAINDQDKRHEKHRSEDKEETKMLNVKISSIDKALRGSEDGEKIGMFAKAKITEMKFDGIKEKDTLWYKTKLSILVGSIIVILEVIFKTFHYWIK